jgi:hypothetical protein
LNFRNAIAIQEQEGFKFTNKELKEFKNLFRPDITIEEINILEKKALAKFKK